MWSMAFYIMENTNDGEVVEQLDEAATARKKDWCTNMLNLAISEASKVSTNEISHGIYLVILTGLERLVIEQIPDEAQLTIFHFCYFIIFIGSWFIFAVEMMHTV